MTGIHSAWFVGAFIRQRCYLFSDKLRYVITLRFGAGDAADILYIVILPRWKSPQRCQEPSALVCERRNWVLNGFLYPRRSDGILYPDKTFVLSADLTGLYRSSPNTWARLREYKYTTTRPHPQGLVICLMWQASRWKFNKASPLPKTCLMLLPWKCASVIKK